LFGINFGVFAREPAAAIQVAVAAEEAGWDSVWAGEHYVLPDPPTANTAGPPGMAMLDPFVSLGAIAARTSRLLVGLGVIVLPLHQPLMLAKKVASLDRVSGGRLQFGVGVGYLEPEFRALGVELARRGERTMEYLDALRAIWTKGPASFHGDFVDFDGVRAEPLPVQQPMPPLHFGGGVARTYRRAVTQGRGWFGWDLDLAGTERAVAALREVERPAELGPLEITVTPRRDLTIDEDSVAAFAEIGVTRLLPLPPGNDVAETIDFVRSLRPPG
jgi:probable F420-dependent oxidoreductase